MWGSPGSPPQARDAALKLAYGDYLDLTPEERLTLLVALTHAAMNSDPMIAEISMRVDHLGVMTTRRDGGAGDEFDDEGGRLASAAATAVAQASKARPLLPSTAAAPLEDGTSTPSPPRPPEPVAVWQKWASAQNIGIRRPLGTDFRGRRYWAMGRQSGAFRVYCESADGKAWGWYEGESIKGLLTWLSSVRIRCETPLVNALKVAPLPSFVSSSTGGTGTTTNALQRARELAVMRLDGYRGLSLPLLRGEWNNRKEGPGQVPPSMELRIPLAMDALLGAIPSWFKGEAVQRHIVAISEVIASATHGRDAARALLEAERLLHAERCLSEEWVDVWQAHWRRVVAGLQEIRDVPLCVSALQAHVATAPDTIPRAAFMKVATETSFVLTIPSLGDTVIVLRAGLLRHLDKYMQIIGVAAKEEEEEHEQRKATATGEREVEGDQQQHATSTPGVSDDGNTNGGGGPRRTTSNKSKHENDDDDDNESTPPPPVRTGGPFQKRIPLPPPKVKESAIPKLQGEWESLRQRVSDMHPAERYIVQSVVYRRHLCDLDELQDANKPATRAPVAWVFLRPAKFAPRHQLPSKDIVLPVAIVPNLPDYLLKVEAYHNGTRVSWQAGDRFRMFFGGKISEKTLRKVKAGGTWHKGEVMAVEPSAPSRWAPLEEKEAYDPWESVVVRWDHLADDYVDRVNPWELEIDPEEEQRRWDEARRQQQAAARAHRARASSRRMPDDPLYEEQAEEWAAEDAKLAKLAAQAQRAELLLSIHKAKSEPEETAFNDAVYGALAQQQRQILLATVGTAALIANSSMSFIGGLGPQKIAYQQQYQQNSSAVAIAEAAAAAAATAAATAGLGTRSSGPASAPSQHIASWPTGPLKPGQEVPINVLEGLRSLTPPEFTTLLTNFHRGLRGKFKIPTFAHKELDLHAVWWAVMDRGGGYEGVTLSKQWRDICRGLPDLDLSGQTSASYNMRLNYERCLLDFENYLASGQYEVDVAAGVGPVHTHLTDPLVTRFFIPGSAVPSVPSGGGGGNNGAGFLLASLGGGGGGGEGSDDDGGAMMTMENTNHQVPSMQQQGQGQQQQENEKAGAIRIPFGLQLRRLSMGAVGKVVQRYWPEEGGWWNAVVSAFKPSTQEHQLTYNAGTLDESFEWVDLGELGDAEFREQREGEDVVVVSGRVRKTGVFTVAGRGGKRGMMVDDDDDEEEEEEEDDEDLVDDDDEDDDDDLGRRKDDDEDFKLDDEEEEED